MEDGDLIAHIQTLLDEEQDLRVRHGDGHRFTAQEKARLETVEVELDRCWDLLRQRRAREEFGLDPDEAEPRPAETVERYWQ